MRALKRLGCSARARVRLLCVVVAVYLAGAVSANAAPTRADGDPFAVPEPSAQLRTEEILPRDTDPEIDTALAPHYVAFDPSIPRQNRLFLFLTGGFSEPSRGRNATTLITKQAAANGFHAINLSHITGVGVVLICGGEATPDAIGDCWEKNRLAIIYGGQTDKLTVSRPNSIENRLVRLLSFLDEEHPDEGWARYLEDDSPKWSRIIVAGWSQGGGHAPLIARDHKVARVIMLEAPADRTQLNPPANPAPWLFERHVTPTERYFGLAHVRGLTSVPGAKPGDPFFLESAWRALGMRRFGETINVDTAEPPFNETHQLITNVEPAPSAPLLSRTGHHSVVVDSAMPKDADGRAVLAVVWQYLMRAPSNGEEQEECCGEVSGDQFKDRSAASE